MSLKSYLMILMLASWNWGAWAFLLEYPYNVSCLFLYAKRFSLVAKSYK